MGFTPESHVIRGYARVSTTDQDASGQHAELHAAGVTQLYTEKASGGNRSRAELARLLDDVFENDVVVVVRLERLARSLRDLLSILHELEERGAGFRSIHESIDTTTPAGRLLMQMLGAFAEFERAMIVERTTNGLARARARGVRVGRPPKLTEQQVDHCEAQIRAGAWTKADAARFFGVSRSTITRTLQRR